MRLFALHIALGAGNAIQFSCKILFGFKGFANYLCTCSFTMINEQVPDATLW